MSGGDAPDGVREPGEELSLWYTTTIIPMITINTNEMRRRMGIGPMEPRGREASSSFSSTFSIVVTSKLQTPLSSITRREMVCVPMASSDGENSGSLPL